MSALDTATKKKTLKKNVSHASRRDLFKKLVRVGEFLVFMLLWSLRRGHFVNGSPELMEIPDHYHYQGSLAENLFFRFLEQKDLKIPNTYALIVLQEKSDFL